MLFLILKAYSLLLVENNCSKKSKSSAEGACSTLLVSPFIVTDN